MAPSRAPARLALSTFVEGRVLPQSTPLARTARRFRARRSWLNPVWRESSPVALSSWPFFDQIRLSVNALFWNPDPLTCPEIALPASSAWPFSVNGWKPGTVTVSTT